jgi:hypothetical protein
MFRYIVQSEILEVYIFQVAAFLHLFEYVKKHLIAIQKFYFPISLQRQHNGCFLKFGVEVGVELSIVNAPYRLRITDQLFKSYAFAQVVRSQSTLQRLLRRQI